jgi:WG containing repeat
MRPLLVLTFLFLCLLTFGQKSQDYLVSYTDTSSGRNLIGFKTIKGQIVINAKYSFVYTDTFYKMAVVKADFKWLCINRNEKIILTPFIFDNGPDYVEEGLFRFVENNKIGFANLDGDKIISAQFDFATPFENGLSKYTLGGHREYEKGGEHWYWIGGYENGYLNKFGDRFKKISEMEKDKRQAWTTKNIHVLLNRDGQIIKTFEN